MTALAAELYQDPRLVMERAETGDVIPVTTLSQQRCCLSCVHAKSRRPWCMLNNMPSPYTGCCAKWRG